MRTDLAEGLPRVIADRVQLQQLLTKLAARHWSGAGDRTFHCRVARWSHLLCSRSERMSFLAAADPTLHPECRMSDPIV